MSRKRNLVAVLLLTLSILSGCGMRTVDQMYSLPKRSAEFQKLQSAIDGSMTGLEYSSPLSGENQQTVQMADLDGDGEPEYLLYAKGSSDNPMQILIFKESDGKFLLMQTIKNSGTAFAQAEYVNLDGEPGAELVVGLRVSDRLPRYLAVYSFSGGNCRQLMTVNYAKFLTTDLNRDGYAELMVVSDTESENTTAVSALYTCVDGSMVRSMEAPLSGNSDQIRRMMLSTLHGGAPAVYIASAVGQNSVITDVLSLREGVFSNISLSNESGTSVQTMRNFFIYADDIDRDGTLELPELITMAPVEGFHSTSAQHLIRWYSMDLDGNEITKCYTFHSFDGGWYLHLEPEYAPRCSVIQQGRTYGFYIWDEQFTAANKVLTVYALNGSKRQEQALEDGRFVLYKTDGVIFAAKLEESASDFGMTANSLTEAFHLIHMDWKSGEIE